MAAEMMSIIALTGFHDLKMKRSFQRPFQVYIQKKHIADHLELGSLDAAAGKKQRTVIR
jgi:1,2-phenylacetyl-CoA epoxidase PaaB subunit